MFIGNDLNTDLITSIDNATSKNYSSTSGNSLTLTILACSKISLYFSKHNCLNNLINFIHDKVYMRLKWYSK